MLDEWKEVFMKGWMSGWWCSRRWVSGKRCSRSAGGVEGGVQEVLEEWKEVFKKCWRSGRRC